MNAAPPLRHTAARRRGFTMLEALIALLLLAGGMLGMTQVQSGLRANADLARERSAAVRLAQAETERLRGFTDPAAWASMADEPAHDVTPSGSSVRFTLERQVQGFAGVTLKAVRITLRWSDRQGTAQQLQLDTLIGGQDPTLSGALALPHPAIGQP